MNMKKNIFMILFFVFSLSFLINLADAEVSVCCEKTIEGSFCQNMPDADFCALNSKSAPTSCDSTSFCRTGCCFNTQSGICMENTPQHVCDQSGGSWSDSASCNIPQCDLGCCVLEDQAALVTLTHCKSLSGQFGIETNFLKEITDENECISYANSQDKGACVYEVDYQKTCRFTTRGQCKTTEGSVNGTITNSSNIEFYKDQLCTSEKLGTNCAPTEKTTCVEGKEEVYFIDTCGNIANIYDASKIDDQDYWERVVEKSESCGAGGGNGNSKSCGNCNYALGSICKPATRENSPSYGDYVCQDLSCKSTSDGSSHKHGESWCSYDSEVGEGKDRVGSRHFKHVCINGEEIVEPCADFRGEVCVESTTNGFIEARCRANRWSDCMLQLEKGDCENNDVRDCMWVEDGYTFSKADASSGISGLVKTQTKEVGLCLPQYPPGFNFWGTSQTQTTENTEQTEQRFGTQNQLEEQRFGLGAKDALSIEPLTNLNTLSNSGSDICKMGDAVLKIVYEKKLTGNTECVENCKEGETKEKREAWAEQMNDVCISLGDCGGYVNYIGEETDDGYALYYQGKRQSGAGGAKKYKDYLSTDSNAKATGNVVQGLIKSITGNK